MNPLDVIASLVSNFTTNLFVKVFVLILAVFYFVFTLVTFQKVNLMTHILETRVSLIVKVLTLVQIVGVALLFTLAVFLL